MRLRVKHEFKCQLIQYSIFIFYSKNGDDKLIIKIRNQKFKRKKNRNYKLIVLNYEFSLISFQCVQCAFVCASRANRFHSMQIDDEISLCAFSLRFQVSQLILLYMLGLNCTEWADKRQANAVHESKCFHFVSDLYIQYTNPNSQLCQQISILDP